MNVNELMFVNEAATVSVYIQHILLLTVFFNILYVWQLYNHVFYNTPTTIAVELVIKCQSPQPDSLTESAVVQGTVNNN